MHNIFELCCEGYDKLLERQFQKPERTKKKVSIRRSMQMLSKSLRAVR